MVHVGNDLNPYFHLEYKKAYATDMDLTYMRLKNCFEVFLLEKTTLLQDFTFKLLGYPSLLLPMKHIHEMAV